MAAVAYSYFFSCSFERLLMGTSVIDAVTDDTLHVSEALSKFAPDASSAVIVVESGNPDFGLAIEELKSIRCRNLALRFAASRGMGEPAINGITVPVYP